MYRESMIATALLIAICCLAVFIRQIIICKKVVFNKGYPVLSLVFLVKNQQDVIEGLVRQALGESVFTAEVIALDQGSVDQTKMILERLSGQFQTLCLISGSEAFERVYDLCRGDTIYCIDLTNPINYELMSRTIHSILNGSRSSLYRTKVLYKN